MSLSMQKHSHKTPKPNFCRLAIQEPVFSVPNTEFEGGGDGHAWSRRLYFFWPNKPNPAIAPGEQTNLLAAWLKREQSKAEQTSHAPR